MGDILSRFQSVFPIRQFLTEAAIAAALDGILLVFTLSAMVIYSAPLAVIALAFVIAYAMLRLLLLPSQRAAQEEAIATAGREQSVMIESLRGITTLRLFNREMDRHAFWQSQLTDAMNANLQVSRINAWQQAANSLLFGIELFVSSWLAVHYVIVGTFSLGMIFAFMAYKSQFIQKASSLTDQFISFRMLAVHLQRLSEIVFEQEDISFRCEVQSDRKLIGEVQLVDVSFSYGPDQPDVLRNVNLTVNPGEHVAITGPSGGGKSTLIKILLGLIEPTSGQVLIDGCPLALFGYKQFHDQVGAILQDDSIFAGSLADNIALFDDEADAQNVVEAAKSAALHDEIMAMTMAYETLVGDMGSSLSGGQRQRLMLARALYRKPRLLVIDEGTSALDSVREKMVSDEISRLGVTRIAVAHRRETISRASKIYRLENGSILEVS